nr:MAG TPA: hypothetical protein [Caudoviricetes sp.]
MCNRISRSTICMLYSFMNITIHISLVILFM